MRLISCLTGTPSVSLSFIVVDGLGRSFTPQSHFSRPSIHHPSKLCFPAIFFFLFAHLLTPFLSLLSFVRYSFVPSSVFCQTCHPFPLPPLLFPSLSLLWLSLSLTFFPPILFFAFCVCVCCCRVGELGRIANREGVFCVLYRKRGCVP